MALKRENVGDHRVLYVRSDASEEFDAFDQLGPGLKQALRDGPIKCSSIAILQQIADKNREIELQNVDRERMGWPPRPLLDPKNPELDAFLVRGLVELNVKTISLDRHIDDALLSVKPLRAKRTRRAF